MCRFCFRHSSAAFSWLTSKLVLTKSDNTPSIVSALGGHGFFEHSDHVWTSSHMSSAVGRKSGLALQHLSISCTQHLGVPSTICGRCPLHILKARSVSSLQSLKGRFPAESSHIIIPRAYMFRPDSQSARLKIGADRLQICIRAARMGIFNMRGIIIMLHVALGRIKNSAGEALSRGHGGIGIPDWRACNEDQLALEQSVSQTRVCTPHHSKTASPCPPRPLFPGKARNVKKLFRLCIEPYLVQG